MEIALFAVTIIIQPIMGMHWGKVHAAELILYDEKILTTHSRFSFFFKL